MKGLNSVIALLGLAIWWLLLFSLWMGWLTPFPIIAAIFVLVILSLWFRSHSQIVSIWMPAFIIAGLSTIAALLTALVALTVLVGYQPQSLFGALSAGVFVFMAIPITVAGILAAVIFFLLFKYRPKSFPQPLSSLAMLNTLALGVFIAVCYQTIFISARDPMIVHVLDSQDRPISLATIQYANYTTKADGGTETEPEETGTLTTDAMGTAKFSPDYLARRVVLDLSKDGYGKIKATLVNDDVVMGDQGSAR